MPRRVLSLVKPACIVKTCPKFGEVHERCKGHKRNGDPCTQFPMSGQFVCKMHGGKTPRGLQAGRVRQAITEVKSQASRIVAFDDNFDETPEEGLLRQIRWSAQVSIALGGVLSESDSLVHSASGMTSLTALTQMWQRERELHARLCKMAIDAGIEQRRIDLMEQQASLMVAAMLALLTHADLGLTAEQVQRGRVVAAEVLRTMAVPALGAGAG